MRVLYFSDNGSDHNRRFLEKIGSFGHEVFFLDFTGQEPRFFCLPELYRSNPRQTFPRDVAPDAVEAFLPNCSRGCESCGRIFFMPGRFKVAGTWPRCRDSIRWSSCRGARICLCMLKRMRSGNVRPKWPCAEQMASHATVTQFARQDCGTRLSLRIVLRSFHGG